MRAVRAEGVLAFAFGGIFCGVLAYAALRSGPPLKDQNFFLLRVIAALSAAGIAAVFPRMLRVESRNLRLSISIGASLAVFIIVYSRNPPALVNVSKKETDLHAIVDGLRGLTDLDSAQSNIPTVLLGGCELDLGAPGETSRELITEALEQVSRLLASIDDHYPDDFFASHATTYADLKRGLYRRRQILRSMLARQHCDNVTADEYVVLMKDLRRIYDATSEYISSNKRRISL